MTSPEKGPYGASQSALDAVSAVLFGVFVALLLAGFLNLSPKLPYSILAGVPLLGSLISLWWANASYDKLSLPKAIGPIGP